MNRVTINAAGNLVAPRNHCAAADTSAYPETIKNALTAICPGVDMRGEYVIHKGTPKYVYWMEDCHCGSPKDQKAAS